MRRTLLATLLLASTAFAQIHEPDRTIFRKRTDLDFSATPVDGTTAKPSDSYIPVRRPAKFANLIKIRGDFRPELQKSVDQL
jgi:hypothetical protein